MCNRATSEADHGPDVSTVAHATLDHVARNSGQLARPRQEMHGSWVRSRRLMGQGRGRLQPAPTLT